MINTFPLFVKPFGANHENSNRYFMPRNNRNILFDN